MTKAALLWKESSTHQGFSMSGRGELEKIAAGYARQATHQDRDGMKELAAANYQRAVEILTTLKNLSRDDLHSEIYEDKIQRYVMRIQQLKIPFETKKTEREPIDDTRFLTKEKPDIKFSDVVISEATRKTIQESIILRIKRPDLFKFGGVKGVLLFGPPGCGKTLLSAAIANEANANLFAVDAASIMSKWLGESEKNLATVFDEARSVASMERPSIIFIDELDTLASVNSSEVGGEVRTRSQLLNEMDNILDKKRPLNLYVIAATNKPWALDEAFLRRFQKRIYLDLPDKWSRVKLIEAFSTQLKLDPTVDLEELALLMRGYSGSDIRDVFESVESKLVQESTETTPAETGIDPLRVAEKRDFEEVIRRRKASVSESSLSYYRKWAESFAAL